MAIKEDDCIHSLEKGLYKFSLRSQIGPEAPCWLFTEGKKKKRRATGNRREKREENRRRMRGKRARRRAGAAARIQREADRIRTMEWGGGWLDNWITGGRETEGEAEKRQISAAPQL